MHPPVLVGLVPLRRLVVPPLFGLRRDFDFEMVIYALLLPVVQDGDPQKGLARSDLTKAHHLQFPKCQLIVPRLIQSSYSWVMRDAETLSVKMAISAMLNEEEFVSEATAKQSTSKST